MPEIRYLAATTSYFIPTESDSRTKAILLLGWVSVVVEERIGPSRSLTAYRSRQAEDETPSPNRLDQTVCLCLAKVPCGDLHFSKYRDVATNGQHIKTLNTPGERTPIQPM